MTYTEVCKGLKKEAAGEVLNMIGSGAKLLGYTIVAALAAKGLLAGWTLSKAGSPTAYDMQNLAKQNRLNRLNRDIQTQLLLQQRQRNQYDQLRPKNKTMRVFG